MDNNFIIVRELRDSAPGLIHSLQMILIHETRSVEESENFSYGTFQIERSINFPLYIQGDSDSGHLVLLHLSPRLIGYDYFYISMNYLSALIKIYWYYADP